MNETQRPILQEDEIDLRELFKTLWDKKVFIALFTCSVTVLAIVYALLKTPIYEARALVEIGSYKTTGSSNAILLDNVSQLQTRLQTLFIDMLKDQKNKPASIAKVSAPKGSQNFLQISAKGLSSQDAAAEIGVLLKHVQAEHQEVLNDVKQKIEHEIYLVDQKIDTIKTKQIPLLDEKISLQSVNLQAFSEQLKGIEDNLRSTQSQNPSLAALQLMQKRDITNFALNLNLQILEMQNKRDELATSEIGNLYESKKLLELSLLPYNYKNTQIIGEIITSKSPVAPKKKLIVMVGAVTGFIFSIFLVFLMQFIRGDEATASKA